MTMRGIRPSQLALTLLPLLALVGCYSSPDLYYRGGGRDSLREEEGPNMASIEVGDGSSGVAAHIKPSQPGLPTATVEDDRRGSTPADRESFIVVSEHQAKASRIHRVRKGDTLSKIARMYYGNDSDWKAQAKRIHEANRDVIRDPNVLAPGTELRLP